MSYAIDYTPFMQERKIRPLFQGSVINHNGLKYSVDRIFRGEDQHCYVFVPINAPERKSFAGKPESVAAAIAKNKIKIEKL